MFWKKKKKPRAELKPGRIDRIVIPLEYTNKEWEDPKDVKIIRYEATQDLLEEEVHKQTL